MIDIWVGICKCGQTVSAMVDSKHPDQSKDLGDWIRDGREVKKIKAESVTLQSCKCGKADQ